MGDPTFLAWLRDQPCACQPCAARAEAHHSTVAPTFAPGERAPKQLPGKRGRGQRSADFYAFALCPRHHGQLHRLTGFFAGMSGDDLEQWQNEKSAAYRNRYEQQSTDTGASKSRSPPPRGGFDINAEAEELGRIYQPEGGQMRLELRRVLRRAFEAGEKAAGGR